MKRSQHAFSLVEVAIALGLVAFVLLSVVGLLSIGINSNKVSIEETRAASLLTLIEADLRNSAPTNSQSLLFGLTLPYAVDADGNVVRAALSSGLLSSVGLNESEQRTNLSGARSRYQASVYYSRVPSAGQFSPVMARIIVNWPGTNTTNVSDLTRLGAVQGYVESLVTFPAP